MIDKALLMDKLFAFLKEFQDFEELLDIQYDEKSDLVRVKIGFVEKVIQINDKSSCISIVSQVISWFAG